MITRLYYIIKSKTDASNGILQADLVKQGNRYFVEYSIVKISVSFPVPAQSVFEIEKEHLKKWGRRFEEILRERAHEKDDIEIMVDLPLEPQKPKKWFHQYRKGLK